jgi:carboxylesterase type B
MVKFAYQALVFSFFRRDAGSVLKTYASYSKRVEASSNPDYRFVLAQIIGDYLFRCPNMLAASSMNSAGTPVFLYEFALPTKIPGLPACTGLSCHTAELPYVFDQKEIIAEKFSFLLSDINSGNLTKTLLESIFGAATSILGKSRNSQSSELADFKVSTLMVSISAHIRTLN